MKSLKHPCFIIDVKLPSVGLKVIVLISNLKYNNFRSLLIKQKLQTCGPDYC